MRRYMTINVYVCVCVSDCNVEGRREDMNLELGVISIMFFLFCFLYFYINKISDKSHGITAF